MWWGEVVEGNGVSNEGHGYLRWKGGGHVYVLAGAPGCRQGTIFVWWTSLMVEREKVGIDK